MPELRCPGCQTALDQHPASRCLDVWVAEVVLGWRPVWAVVLDVGVPLRLTLASSQPFTCEELYFGMNGGEGPPWVDVNRCSLEEWAQTVDRLCAETQQEGS